MGRAVAVGFVLLHQANKTAPAMLLKAAGSVLVAGGIIVGTCTTLYWFKYQSQGDFDGAHSNCGMRQGPGPGMGSMPHGTMAPSPADGTK